MVAQSEVNINISMVGVPILVIDVKPDNRFVYTKGNRATEEYFGITIDEYQGREAHNFEGMSEPQIIQRKQVIEHYKQCVGSKQPVIWERKYLRPDSSYRWGRHTLIPIFDEAGEVQELMVTIVDITDLVETRKHLEEALTKTLSGFVVICAACKNIRHEGNWRTIEQYALEQMDFRQFSHSVCPSCQEELYGSDILETKT